MAVRPILLLELNEIPLRIYEKYAADPRFPNVARLLKESSRIDTLNGEQGELSPWCTWPTLHRGLPKEKHGVFHLGQDPATYRGTPIWEEYRRKGMSVGIFGSLQSWPPKDPGEGGFFVPDTFSPSPECFPSWLEPVQKFNLGLVRENGRTLDGGIASRAISPALWLGLVRGVRPGTLLRAAGHVVAERFNPSLRDRRVSYQAILFWDIFRKLYDPEHPPAFTTFFTNHVASVMHRHWNHIFPEDFPEQARPKERIHVGTMDFAMRIIDGILGESFSWQERNPALLVLVANSMGQETKLRPRHEGAELLFLDPPRLLELLGVKDSVKQNLAMAPQVALDFETSAAAENAQRLLRTVTTKKGTAIFLADVRESTVSVTTVTPRLEEITDGEILVRGKPAKLAQAGIRKLEAPPSTAYHIPEGLLFAHGLEEAVAPKSRPIPAEEVKGLLMEWSGLSR